MNLWDVLYRTEQPRQVVLGWDWMVARSALAFRARPRTGRLMQEAACVLDYENLFSGLDDAALQENLQAFRVLFRCHRESRQELLQALCAVREAAFRTRGERAYQTQIAGALGLLDGSIVEMATGEGKTLTAALAATLEAWRGRGCHVITSNDYLAARDAELMSSLYAFCGARVGIITQNSSRDERMLAYGCDVTYLTSKDVAADMLRDGLELGECTSLVDGLAVRLDGGQVPSLVQRGLACAIVDEADSVLCDGGSTPLIISGEKGAAPIDAFLAASNLADTMELGGDYRLNQAFREAQLTDAGRKRIYDAVAAGHFVCTRSRACELVLQALEARRFFHASVQYVIHDGKVVIVDEATGRPMPDHEWRDGMHQAVSAKEGLEVQPPRITCAQITFQSFFLRYPKLSGMTGTAWEARGELLQFYGLFVVRIPTNQTCRRKELRRWIWPDTHAKLEDIVVETAREYAQNRPVLIGTRSIEGSEALSSALHAAGLPHEVLNAVQHEREAEIIARAGSAGAITVATNMAGRGTDIKLDPDIRSAGMHVILTERHASPRVDRQLRGRCARQGDFGTTSDLISLEDVLFELLPKFVLTLLRNILQYRWGQGLGWIVVAWCQWSGDRNALRQRKNLLKSCRDLDLLMSFAGKKR